MIDKRRTSTGQTAPGTREPKGCPKDSPGDFPEARAKDRAGDPVAESITRIEARLARLENDSGKMTVLIMGDLAGIRADLLYLHDRIDAIPGMVRNSIREEIALATRRRLQVVIWLVIAFCAVLALIFLSLTLPDALQLLRYSISSYQ